MKINSRPIEQAGAGRDAIAARLAEALAGRAGGRSRLDERQGSAFSNLDEHTIAFGDERVIARDSRCDDQAVVFAIIFLCTVDIREMVTPQVRLPHVDNRTAYIDDTAEFLEASATFLEEASPMVALPSAHRFNRMGNLTKAYDAGEQVGIGRLRRLKPRKDWLLFVAPEEIHDLLSIEKIH
jgi:hypothetical protein